MIRSGYTPLTMDCVPAQSNMGARTRKRVPRKAKNSILTTVDTPAARQVQVRSRPPRVQTQGNRTRISGHEQIFTASGSVGFVATKFQVNPGLGFYTWLSQRATGWEKYKLSKFVVHYIPAEANTTTPGSVYLAADYDPSDPPPLTLQALSTYETQANGRVYNALSLPINVNRMFDGVQTKYIREGPVPGDLSLYDAASFTFATISCSDAGPIGQIWVEYVVDLISPQTETANATPSTLSIFGKPELDDQDLDNPVNVSFAREIVNGAGVEYRSFTRDFKLPKANWLIDGVLHLEDLSGATVATAVVQRINGSGVVNNNVTSTGATVTNIPIQYYVVSDGNTLYSIQGSTDGETTTVLADGTSLRFRVV